MSSIPSSIHVFYTQTPPLTDGPSAPLPSSLIMRQTMLAPRSKCMSLPYCFHSIKSGVVDVQYSSKLSLPQVLLDLQVLHRFARFCSRVRRWELNEDGRWACVHGQRVGHSLGRCIALGLYMSPFTSLRIGTLHVSNFASIVLAVFICQSEV